MQHTDPAVSTARILLLSSSAEDLSDAREVLLGTGYHCHWCPLNDAMLAADAIDNWDLILLDGTDQDPLLMEICGRWRERLGDAFLPIILITDDVSLEARLTGYELGADAHMSRPLDLADLLARVQSLLRLKALQDRLAEQNRQISHMNQQMRLAQRRIDMELKLAQRLQQGLLPKDLPQIGNVRFAAHHMMCGQVGGDFYDVFRLDEKHVGFYIADAIGHGVPAALLTVYVKKGITTKQITGNSYRVIPPDEVLRALNLDMASEEFADNLFITMIYGLLNLETLELTFSRAGHPYPLLVEPDGTLTSLPAEGPLLGVFDADFPTGVAPIKPGQKVLLYTDGIDSVQYAGLPPGPESFQKCVQDLARLPADQFIAELHAQLFTSLDGPIPVEDDVTMLCLEVCD